MAVPFAPGKQLPHLKYLNASWVKELDVNHPPTVPAVPAVAPVDSCLVSCCPGLQSLNLNGLQGLTEAWLLQLTQLQQLTTLCVDDPTNSCPSCFRLTSKVRQTLMSAGPALSWDRQPAAWGSELVEWGMSCWAYCVAGYAQPAPGVLHVPRKLSLALPSPAAATAQAAGPVWRQVLRLLVNASDPEVASQAAAALGERPACRHSSA